MKFLIFLFLFFGFGAFANHNFHGSRCDHRGVCYDHHHNGVPCQHYTVHSCPLVQSNVIVYPVVPNWYMLNLQASVANACAYQYRSCLYYNYYNPYNLCVQQYYSCMGYFYY